MKVYKQQQIQDVSEALLTSMTEAEFANWHREQGTHIICHQGRYWKETVLGFYQPLHEMARLSIKEATYPTRLSWGFQASLCDDDAAIANGSIPVHLLSNVANYDFSSLRSKSKKNLRQCYQLVKIVQLTSSTLLQEQGYEVLVSALRRRKSPNIPSKKEYLAELTDYFTPGRRLVLAGLIDNQLSGYLTGYAVDGTAYMENRIIASEVLKTEISSGLTFEFVQACRRSGNIRQVVSGLHVPDNPGLRIFKERMGFPVQHIPAKFDMNPIMEKFLRWLYPDKYYRLTGHDYSSQALRPIPN